MLEHHCAGENRRQRIGQFTARDVGSRSMYRLEHGWVSLFRIEIGTRGETEAPGDDRAEVRQDVTEQIRGHDYIEALGPANQIHACRVDQQRFRADLRVLPADFGKDSIPEGHAEPLRVRFCNRSQQLLLVALARELKCKADHPFSPVPCEYSRLNRDFFRPAGVKVPANLRVFTFGVFTHDGEINFTGLLTSQRRTRPLVEYCRSNAGILIERSTNGQQQTVEGDIVLEARVTDCAKVNRIQWSQLIERIRSHHRAVLEIVVRSPGKMRPFKLKAKADTCGFKHLDAGGNHLLANTISGNHCYAISFHLSSLEERS